MADRALQERSVIDRHSADHDVVSNVRDSVVSLSSSAETARFFALEGNHLRAGELAEMVEELAGEFYTQPLLRRILTYSIRLLQADAGSVSIVNQERGVYHKAVDIGIGCRSGQVFPLNEGMTGVVVAQGRPVAFSDYAQVPGGHLGAEDGDSVRGVIGVPIVWHNAIVGVFVLFSRDPKRQFTEEDGAALQVFAKYAALALANAQLYEEAEARSRVDQGVNEPIGLRRGVYDLVTRGFDFAVDQIWAASQLLDRQPDAAARLELARRTIEATSDDVKRAMVGSFPIRYRGSVLKDAIEAELFGARTVGRVQGNLSVSGDVRSLASDVSDHLVFVVREALDCIVRRPGEHIVSVSLIYGTSAVVLLIHDDGYGDVAGDDRAERFINLSYRTIAERTHLLAGSFETKKLGETAHQVRVTVPVDGSASGISAVNQVKVMVVAASPVIRTGIVQLLGEVSDVDVVAVLSSGREALDAHEVFEPDVTLVDLQLSDMTSSRFVRGLQEATKPSAPLALKTGSEDPLVSEVLRMGACGCVGLDVDSAALGTAIRTAHHGGARLSTSTLRELHAQLTDVHLTAREREIRSLVEMGLPDREIAKRLSISVKTVEKHVGSVLRKTGSKNRTELAVARQRA